MRNNILIAFEKFIEGFTEYDQANGEHFLDHENTFYIAKINSGIVEIENINHNDEDIVLGTSVKAEIEIELEKMLEREIDKPTGQNIHLFRNHRYSSGHNPSLTMHQGMD